MLPALTSAARDALARRHFPEGMAFDAEQEGLLRRGYPFLRLLTEGTAEDKKAARIAEKHLKAIDPTRGVSWPRGAARRYVHAFGGSNPDDAGDVDVAALDAVLGKLGFLGYDFLFLDAMWLVEAFLGPRVVAERTLEALAALSPETTNDRPALFAINAVFCLELALLRASDPALLAHAESVLRGIAPSWGKHVLGHRLAMTLEGAPPSPLLNYSVACLSIDEAFFPVYLEHEYAAWLVTPQLVRVGGPGLVTSKILAGMRRDSAWKQKERCEVFAGIRHPFVVEMFAGMLGSKAAAGMPEAWLAEHLAFATSTLERLVAERHPNAEAIRGIVSGEPSAAAPPKKMTARELDRVVAAGFARIKRELPKVRGHAERERTLLREVVHAIVEARAAIGEVIPEAHLGHILMLDGWGKLRPPLGELSEDEVTRYGQMIDEASSS